MFLWPSDIKIEPLPNESRPSPNFRTARPFRKPPTTPVKNNQKTR